MNRSEQVAEQQAIEVIDEVNRLLEKHDLAGVVYVMTPHRFHWKFVLSPSWSAVSYNEQTGEIRVRSKGLDFKSPAVHRRVTELSVGMVMCLRRAFAAGHQTMDNLTRRLNAKFEISQESSDYRPR